MDAFENLRVLILDTHRSYAMYANIIFEILSILLLIVAMSGNSENSGQIETAAWTIQLDKNDNIIGYYGTKAFTPANGNEVTTFKSCASTNTICEDCKVAGLNALNSTVFTFFFVVAMLVMSVLRRGTGDKWYYKLTAVVCGACALLCMIIGMGSWDNQCVESLSTSGGVTYKLGPGLSSVLVTLFFTIFPTVSHLLISTKDNDLAPVPSLEATVVSGSAI